MSDKRGRSASFRAEAGVVTNGTERLEGKDWYGNNAVNMRKKPLAMQPCPVCGHAIGALAGSKDAICRNCGYKDPCCE